MRGPELLVGSVELLPGASQRSATTKTKVVTTDPSITSTPCMSLDASLLHVGGVQLQRGCQLWDAVARFLRLYLRSHRC